MQDLWERTSDVVGTVGVYGMKVLVGIGITAIGLAIYLFPVLVCIALLETHWLWLGAILTIIVDFFVISFLNEMAKEKGLQKKFPIINFGFFALVVLTCLIALAAIVLQIILW